MFIQKIYVAQEVMAFSREICHYNSMSNSMYATHRKYSSNYIRKYRHKTVKTILKQLKKILVRGEIRKKPRVCVCVCPFSLVARKQNENAVGRETRQQ